MTRQFMKNKMKRLGKQKYLSIHRGRIAEIIKFPNGEWIIADITRSDARTVTGTFRTLREYRESLV